MPGTEECARSHTIADRDKRRTPTCVHSWCRGWARIGNALQRNGAREIRWLRPHDARTVAYCNTMSETEGAPRHVVHLATARRRCHGFTAGTYSVVFPVDPDLQVTELDKTDNTFTLQPVIQP